ncbi:uncharacterized protein LOC107853237 [Capsicum annuum]|uniref:uncharacterized protein LOC107853237 n=1 Tax=Capsicum annuum TaxID=4072 RepID=UPI001FB0FF41|nr:uncharacterized protein LOC107853237 [Capsicum annuum]
MLGRGCDCQGNGSRDSEAQRVRPHEKGYCGRQHSFIRQTRFCFISDRHKSIANDIAKVYNHAHHEYCTRHLDENLQVNHHSEEQLYLFYNAAKVYYLEEFSNHFVEFKNYCPEVAFFLKHDLGFEKWSRAYFPSNRFNVMTTNITESVNAMLIAEREYPMASIFNSITKRFGEIFRERRAYILKYKDNKFVPAVENILRDNISEGDSFYVDKVSWDKRQFTVFGSSCMAKVDLLERSRSCKKFDLVKIPCEHTMAALRLKDGEDFGLRVYDYSSPMYKVEEYLLAYSESINVVPLKS